MSGVTCTEAASVMRVSASQVRRWVQDGAPVLRERRPMLVEVEALQRWRRDRHADVLGLVAVALLRSVRAELNDGKSAPRLLGIDDRRAAALALAAFSRVEEALAVPDEEGAEVHAAIAQLRRIAQVT